MIRGRTDLTEIIAQASNPYKDGRSLGDMWCVYLVLFWRHGQPSPLGARLPAPRLESKGKGAPAGPPTTLGEFIYRCNHPPDPPPSYTTKNNHSILVSDQTLHPRTGE